MSEKAPLPPAAAAAALSAITLTVSAAVGQRNQEAAGSAARCNTSG